MLHSVCFISRAYPDPRRPGIGDPLIAAEAAMLAETGITVHVISGGGNADASLTVDRGVVMHRLPEPSTNHHPDFDYIAVGLWNQTAGNGYRNLDRQVRFDVVRVTDTFAATLHFGLYKRPETPLVASLWNYDTTVTPRSPGAAALHALNLVALADCDVLLAGASLDSQNLRALTGRSPVVRLLPPPLSVAPGRRRPSKDRRVRMLFLGPLEPGTRPEFAIASLDMARHSGLDARLTLAGPNGFSAYGRPYREAVLEPMLAERGLQPFVRFAADPSASLLRTADCVLLPGNAQPQHLAAAIAASVPVLVGSRTRGLAGLGTSEGLVTCRDENPNTFANDALPYLADLERWYGAASVGAELVRATFRRSSLARTYVEALSDIADQACTSTTPEVVDSARIGTRSTTRNVSIVLPASDTAATRRAITSIAAHTNAAFKIFVVAPRSDRSLTRGMRALGARVRRVDCPPDASVSARRSLGLSAAMADPSTGAIAILGPDPRLHAGWWRPHAEVLNGPNPPAFVGSSVAPSAELRQPYHDLIGTYVDETEIFPGACLVLDADAGRQIGTLDPRLPAYWQDADYMLRARRLGYMGARPRTVEPANANEGLHVPELDPTTHAYISTRWQMLHSRLPDTRQITAVAIAAEVVDHPDLLDAYTRAFSADDDITLVVYAPDATDRWVESVLVPALQRGGVETDRSPDVLVLPLPRDRSEDFLAHSAYAVLSHTRIDGPLAILPRFDSSSMAGLRDVLRRAA